MNKNFIYIGVLVILIAISGVLIWQEQTKEQKPWPKRFGLDDTASVTKIYMVNKANKEVLLERKGNNWMLNNNFPATSSKINMLLATLHDMQVKYPVSKAKRENVIKELAGTATKVEIYTRSKEKPARTFYVGGPTKGKTGTYMVMGRDGEVAEQPYVTHIPGFRGYLTPRFFITHKEWRDLRMFTYSYEEIQSVKVHYPASSAQSYEVQKLQDDSVHVRKIKGNSTNRGKLIKTAARKFLTNFENLKAEAIETKYNKKDSILATTPYAILEVTPKQGVTQQLTIYQKPVTPSTKKQFDRYGDRLKNDPDRLFATLKRNDDFYMIQNYVFGKVLRKYNDFFIQKQPT